ncbi:MAG TPA: type II toxin-antitoxin system HicB family antitoxin [Candidatus Baltobacteraceae bacterium]|nr:type II toxin-antitoxin system HicB family antitoxin [Candidatus Baltobacteraceae bacterium]
MKYAVLYDQATDGTWGAVVPDLPGRSSAGNTLDDVRENVKEAISLWVEVAREQGHPVPPPSTIAETVDVA